ncbi:ABC transporter ATP-binding protein [Treponema pedis]|nr:ABC transporter ATP-binding protein [Treponema pedis]
MAVTKFSNRTPVFDNAKIVQDGNHEELINQEGKYKELYELQAKYYN